MMVATSPKLSAYVLVAIPVIVLPLYAAGRAVRARSRLAQDTLADATAFATESLSAVRVMQAFVAEGFTAARYRAAAMGAFDAARLMSDARAFVTAAALFLAFSSVVVVLWLGAQDVIAHVMSAGVLTQFVLFGDFRRKRARAAFGSLERGLRRRPAPRRASANCSRSTPRIAAPGPSAAPARSGARRSRISRRQLRLSRTLGRKRAL